MQPLQGYHSVLLIIPNYVGALQGGISVLLIILHDVCALQGGHSVQLIIYSIIVLSKIMCTIVHHHLRVCMQEEYNKEMICRSITI